MTDGKPPGLGRTRARHGRERRDRRRPPSGASDPAGGERLEQEPPHAGMLLASSASFIRNAGTSGLEMQAQSALCNTPGLVVVTYRGAPSWPRRCVLVEFNAKMTWCLLPAPCWCTGNGHGTFRAGR